MAATVDTISCRLRDPGTRSAAIESLASTDGPIDRAVVLAAAPALAEILALDAASQIERETCDCAGWLLGRAFADAPDAIAPVFAAAFGDGRWAKINGSDSTVLALACAEDKTAYTRDDIRSMACYDCWWSPASINGLDAFVEASDINTSQFVRAWMPSPVFKTSPETARQLLAMTLTLLRETSSVADMFNDMLVVNGMWRVVYTLVAGHSTIEFCEAALGLV